MHCFRLHQRLEVSDPQIADVIADSYLNGLTIAELTKVYGRSWGSIRAMLERRDLYCPRKTFLTPERQTEAVRLYVDEVLGVPEIAGLLDCTYDVVYNLLKRLGIPRRHDFENGGRRRPLPFNEDAFSILTEDSAYWIGFLMADGWVVEEGKYLHVGCALARKDRGHLLKLNSFLEGGDRTPCDFRKDDSDYSQLIYRSRRMGKDLGRWGVTPRKSLTAKAHETLVHNPHFWRGMLDGDGHVGKRAIGFVTASPHIRDQFSQYLRSIGCDFKMGQKTIEGYDTLYFSFSFKVMDACLLLVCLYGEGIALERKWEAATSFVSRRQGRD